MTAEPKSPDNDETLIEAIYAWTEIHDNGREGVICTMNPLLGGVLTNLQHRDRAIAERMRPIALSHHRASKHRVRFVRFRRDDVLETLE